MAKSLYICYFGVSEPLVHTQVIPYLRELVKDGHEISLLTFEPEPLDAAGVDAGRNACGPDIEWHWLIYHKRFSALATAWDVFQGARFLRKFIARERPDILHGRVHVPTLMAAIARKLSRHKPKVLFDIRGFMPEEYTDAGIWPENGLLYRAAKRVERWLLKESNGFVVLTERARQILFPESRESGFDRLGRPVEVIPCCVDFENRFWDSSDEMSRERARQELGLEGRLVIAHVGALGGLYLNNEIADLIKAAKSVQPLVFALFLTQSDPELMIPLLKLRGLTESDFLVRRVASNEVPKYLAASDIGISFVKATYSTISRSPTKIPEYLASGLPVIANSGVGDVDQLVCGYKVGGLVHEFSCDEYRELVRQLGNLKGMAKYRREVAEREFDLKSVGGERYRRLYLRLIHEN